MSTLTAIQSYLGWHLSIAVIVWGVFLVRFDRVARGFLNLHDEDCWEAQVLRWGFIMGLDVLIPAVLAIPAFYYTGLVHPTGWLIRTSAWLGYWECYVTAALIIMTRFSSNDGCCCERHHRHRHRCRPTSPNRRRHRKPENETPCEVI